MREWRKKHRATLLKLSCAGLLLGFMLAHWGGVSGNGAAVAASFVVFGCSCLLPIMAKK